jgi:phthiocerol/phenolphthiocerol synthesis type-I polyketide synthase E
MAEFERRVAELPPERRKLLEQLLSQNQRPLSTEAERESPKAIGIAPPISPSFNHNPFLRDVKDECRRFYDALSEQLNAGIFGNYSLFLNYGYVADGSPQYAVVKLPEHCLNRNSAKLVLELVGDCPIDGRHVLDVGCGRGGTVQALATFFAPSAVVGVDLSSVAIAFCRRAHHHAGVDFKEGDAEQLPFADASFDVVTNVESSSCYPDLFRFYREVRRVLRPRGHFLYTDCLPVERFSEAIAYLQESGLRLEHNRDVTRNVLRSCDEIAQARLQAYNTEDIGLLTTFLGAPGSQYYEDMRTGKWQYRIMRWQNHQGSPTP